ncbi:MAG: Hpt domain-containing protein [Rhodobacterales bacterium]|jgi:chemotaxis protein histidine kinase CheA|tara:strand:+ start:862 stop:1233 length:372 start_codon:yes stop_codon:yes gene_type:complete|eukprot:GHVR01056620.1.p3 GENE.GHVR01056620.1~~GHVR01056620.1.p3  ORF type:complete len:124 (+),score=25.83 GHVR01056620.1:408-779(+)
MHKKLELPGIERIRARFLEMLEQRQRALAEHALAAWEGTSLQDINDNLTEARRILHQIAGTAGSLGFDDLGTIARDNEVAIDTHLDGPNGKIASCPTEIIFGLDDFLKSSEALIAEQATLESA